MSFATEDRVLSIVAFYSMVALYGDQTLEKTQSLKRRKAWKDPKGNSAYTVNFA